MFQSRSKGIHNHIKTLGLSDQNEVMSVEDSIIGQNDARRAAGVIVDMVRSNKHGGRCFLFTGPSGSGKTALTVAISEELGAKIPFVCLSAPEVYSAEVKKSEILTQSLRKAVLVKIRELKDVYEGEVVNVRDGGLDLRSLKGTKSLRLSRALQDQLKYQDIKVGDVVHIDSSSGIIKRMGRGESHLNDYDLEAEKYVPLPKNEIHKKREFFHETTLHSLDLSLVNPTSQDVLSLVHQVVKHKNTEITDKLRKEVDELISNYEGAEIVNGVLLIDDAHLLDLECFTYIKKVLDSAKAPLLILVSNVKEKNGYKFGIPSTLLKRCLITPLQRNENEGEIIKCRLDKEGIEADEEAVLALTDLSKKNGLVYVINLVKMLKGVENKVGKKEVDELASLFSSN